ncbi:MAG: DUF115 domain-containing protein [Spirochaetaceae bacterium]|jgi:hypothetical protein|nr:DUF115 domain-containing protein [Spirochaetaceae bacterium]
MRAPDFWDKNLSVLRENHPALAQRLEQLEQDAGAPADDAEIIAASSGDATLRVAGVLVHSARDPVREARRLVDAALVASLACGAVVILGFGLGYAAEEAARRAGGAVVIIEKRVDLFRLALRTRDLSGLFKRSRLSFVLGSDALSLGDALSRAGPVRAVIRNRPALSLDGDWAADAEKTVCLWHNKDAVNEATLCRFGKRWVRNLRANSSAIRDMPGVGALAGAFDFPIFVVAAGPSLDDIRPHLSALRERCLVVAVDTALSFIQRAGVSADFALSVDPQYWNARHLDRADLEKTCLVAESSVYPTTLRSGARATFLCSSHFPLARFFEQRVGAKGALGSGGSVATSAWDFARSLLPTAAGAIITAGLDLSYPARKTHFAGALFEERALSEQSRLRPAETASFHALRGAAPYYTPAADGGRVLTDSRLALYAGWFENRARLACAAGLKNHTLSRAGRSIACFEPIDIERVLSLPPRRGEIDRQIERTLQDIMHTWNEDAHTKARAEAFDGAQQNLAAGLEELRRLAMQALILAETDPRSELLEQIDRAIAANPVRDVAGFLVPRLETLQARLKTPADKPLERHRELSILLYRAIYEAACF